MSMGTQELPTGCWQRGEKPTVLVVEDDLNFREIVLFALRKEGMEALHASNGKQALDRLEESLVDVILSDIMMPEMNGVDFFVAVRSIPRFRRTPFVFLTANDDPELRNHAFRLGVDDFLTKPIEKDLVVAKIRDILLKIHASQRMAEAPSLQGSLDQFSLAEVIQIVELARRSGLLEVEGGVDGVVGRLCFEGGTIRHADVGETIGEPAVAEMLGWRHGRFQFRAGDPTPTITISRPTAAVLLTALQTLDERVARGLGDLPA